MLKNTISVLLIAAIVLLVNVLSNDYFLRFDLTENKQYTLSDATKDILRNLEEPLLVTAYFSDNLPEELNKNKRDLQDMLVEYATISRGMIDYEFVTPESDEEKQSAMMDGVQPVMINVREKDQVKQQQAFMGAVMKQGDRQEVIPVLQPGMPMEYELSTKVKKISVIDKQAVGFLQGHGEPTLEGLGQVMQELNILYEVETVDLPTESAIPDRFKTVVLLGPSDTFVQADLDKLDAFLQRGGKMVIGINRVEGDLQNSQGKAVGTGLEAWLAAKGLEVQPNFVTDVQCGTVTVMQQQGFFTMQTPVQFPFLPIITNFADHPISKGLEQVILPFASDLRYNSVNPEFSFTPIAFSSEKSGTVSAPTFFNVQKEWVEADFGSASLPVAGVLEGALAGGAPARMVVIGDGDFPVSGQRRAQSEDNISLLVNSVDWLSDDTGLIDLRTKNVTSRPIKEEFLMEEAQGKRNFYKYLNFLLPIGLVIAYGLFRNQMRRNRRLKRMQESYS